MAGLGSSCEGRWTLLIVSECSHHGGQGQGLCYVSARIQAWEPLNSLNFSFWFLNWENYNVSETQTVENLAYLGSWEILNRWSQKRRRRGRRGRRNFREMQGMLYFGIERGTVLFSTFQTLSAVSNSESMGEWLQTMGKKTSNIAQTGVTDEG